MPEKGGKTCLEIAHTPNLDAMAREGVLGLARTVPPGMEPSSACACMSVLGYDPRIYYRGRSPIEAISMDVPFGDKDVLFRCNLVSIRDGKMWSYSSGYISTEGARTLIEALNGELGNKNIRFFPGTSYRHILRITGSEDTREAICTPPHDIPDMPIAGFLPRGKGSELLNGLMDKSKAILEKHPVNIKRKASGDIPSTQIWLFWGTGKIPAMPAFKDSYKLNAALTSGVDLLKGLAKMMSMELLNIPGVTDGLDNAYDEQAKGAMAALERSDIVVVHVEAPDEAGHDGSIVHKVEAIEKIDSEVIGQFRRIGVNKLRMLIMPDHPTPIKIRTHSNDPVPFLIWGGGFKCNGASVFSEAEARKSGNFVENGYEIMGKLVKGI